ncbi:MAG: TetR/AcrR family transcriptional regulator [Candidatus Adiutrix sp.]|jgi:AcrR family transcriptional regulator|nr:TetR/AcrR family transcriptional regulator [Candidatus Adiutrix sp.]
MESLSTLQLAALNSFAAGGFEGASMSLIAGAAGIRKPTIYAHFISKEDLFLSLLPPVMELEQRYLEDLLSRNQEEADSLLRYLESFAPRMNESPPHLRFLLRSIYLPPESAKERVSRLGRGHYEKLWGLINRKLAALQAPAGKIPDLSAAYLGLMDSVQTCLLYAPAFADERLRSLWKLFKPALPERSLP